LIDDPSSWSHAKRLALALVAKTDYSSAVTNQQAFGTTVASHVELVAHHDAAPDYRKVACEVAFRVWPAVSSHDLRQVFFYSRI
jgi:hypothetical protein